MKTEQLLPKNIRQIGSPVGHTKVYIEDYVITFLNSLSTDKNTYVRGAILFGEKEMVENDTIIYVKGAIEGQNLELDLDETVFNDEVWREIYQQKDRLFPGLEVIGWALLRMGFSVRLNDKIKKTHGEGTGKPYVSIRDAIGDLPSLNPKESKDSYASPPFSEYQLLMRKDTDNILTCHMAPNHPIDTIEKIKNTIPGEPMYPKFKQRIRLAWDIQSPTQVSGGIRPQFQFGHPEDNRGLTIRERCRIQSFPDNFFVHGGIVQGRVQTGNAVPPLLAKAVALAIKEYL